METARLFNFRKLTEEELISYRKNGYLIIRSILKPEGLKQMQTECMEAWSREKESFDPNKSWLQNSLLVNIHHQAATVRDYYFEGPLVEMASEIIGPNIKGATSQLTFKMKGNTKPFGWHQDNGYGELEPYNALTTLTALDDTDRGNGCLWLIPGSHKEGQIRVYQNENQKKSQSEIIVKADDSLAIPMEMKAGDALLFNCWMLHKSDGNMSESRDRRILFLRYADADAVEVYNERKPRLGRLVKGKTKFKEVEAFEADL
ncbi:MULTISPECIES: phytanoyl-CoA dioxygenase family protein [Pedobacter]|uniref:Phytanoyl-CoA dioxygenase n=1 Tax=Pedobacter heparinus (strain ATCC 13125 / DSM 2366 / CIP 104194 / JCM 7457 / NBRC 12017 / NCIMB 9290 / NRRL B-14731 / HIM 762-3) TaxID=485917 RepID=C6XUR5_PEDHD|nr:MULTISPECIES: phytanoyl-CoA dioxygenase family protein [Pedobacter]ACU03915.1 Phytanoyl-CoA dioxygenase [Pedobacter heparinus DSM 2366]MBB5436559.1 ectoine hydroxylase-related dioxygenase (phytanoyl-CoA dioxygenase family) [Pedobacter sp. AK017]